MEHKKESAFAESEQKQILRLERRVRLLSVACLACSIANIALGWRTQVLAEQIELLTGQVSQILVNFDFVLDCIKRGYQSAESLDSVLSIIVQTFEQIALCF